MKKLIAMLMICAMLLGSGCGREPAYTGAPEVAGKYRSYYEIFVASFYDSDGDGCGDLKGIEQKLDYLNDDRAASDSSLHVTGLWLMPIMPSPTYHKYDVTDYYSIDPVYGSLEDFVSLTSAAKQRGVSVIIDLVVNHTSSEHPWFTSACASIGIEPCGQESCPYPQLCREHNPYCGYYNFSQQPTSGTHPVPGVSGWYYEARFWSGMPDLNLDSEAVRGEIADICRFWLDKGAGGFRVDAVTSFYTGSVSRSSEFLGWLSDTVAAIDPDAYMVAETWTTAADILGYAASGVDSCFNFPFSQGDGSVISAVNSGGGAKLAERIEDWQTSLTEANGDAIDAVFLSNHDNARSAGALFRDAVREKQAAAVYLLLPGNPFIYYGEELGMTGSGRDENKRTAFVWSLADSAGQTRSPADADKVELPEAGAAEQLGDEGSLLRFYISAMKLRNANPALAWGSVTACDAGDSAVCAYLSDSEDKLLAVAHNLGDSEVTLDVQAVFGGSAKLSGTLAAGGVQPQLKGGSLTLPAHSTAVLELAVQW